MSCRTLPFGCGQCGQDPPALLEVEDPIAGEVDTEEEEEDEDQDGEDGEDGEEEEEVEVAAEEAAEKPPSKTEAEVGAPPQTEKLRCPKEVSNGKAPKGLPKAQDSLRRKGEKAAAPKNQVNGIKGIKGEDS